MLFTQQRADVCSQNDIRLQRSTSIFDYGPPRTGLEQGHFSHIFLDDVAPVSEPESMIHISYFCLKKTVVVIAGDPMQLGPIIYSKQADKLGLGKSYLERRFYGIQGCEESGGSIPSLFNIIEASKVIEIIQELLGGGKLTNKDIGVIALFQLQVLKIQEALQRLHLSGITVGSVEQFQRRQTQVIIISTVSSTVKLNEIDRGHYLGILSNPRAFNVAITRARALLIIIGNPYIICKCKFLWNEL
ncbi:hypothetical protein ACFE04_003171 [Oxalis oulophora]